MLITAAEAVSQDPTQACSLSAPITLSADETTVQHLSEQPPIKTRGVPPQALPISLFVIF